MSLAPQWRLVGAASHGMHTCTPPRYFTRFHAKARIKLRSKADLRWHWGSPLVTSPPSALNDVYLSPFIQFPHVELVHSSNIGPTVVVCCALCPVALCLALWKVPAENSVTETCASPKRCRRRWEALLAQRCNFSCRSVKSAVVLEHSRTFEHVWTVSLSVCIYRVFVDRKIAEICST